MIQVAEIIGTGLATTGLIVAGVGIWIGVVFGLTILGLELRNSLKSKRFRYIHKGIMGKILNLVQKNFFGLRRIVDIHYYKFIFFIFISYLSINIFEYFIHDISIPYFLIKFFPILGLVLLNYTDKNLVRKELVNRMTFFLFIFIFFIFIAFFIFPFYFYGYFSLDESLIWILKIRAIFSTLVLLILLVYFWRMPWNKENFLKAGILIFTLGFIGSFFFTTGKIFSYIYMNKNFLSEYMYKKFFPYLSDVKGKINFPGLQVKTNLNVFPDNYSGLYQFMLDNNNNKQPFKPVIKQPSKPNIIEILPPLFKNIIKSPCPRKFNSFIWLNSGKVSHLILFNGLIILNLSKPIVSSLVLDTSLYNLSSPPLWISYKNIINTYFSRFPVYCHKNGFLCYEQHFYKKGFMKVIYCPFIGEGFIVRVYNSLDIVWGLGFSDKSSNLNNKLYISKMVKPNKDFNLSCSLPRPKLITYGIDAILDNKGPLYYLIDISSFKDYFLIDNVFGIKGTVWNNTTKHEEVELLISAPYTFNLDEIYNNPLMTDRLIMRPLKVQDSLALYDVANDPLSNFYCSLSYSNKLYMNLFESYSMPYYMNKHGLRLGAFLKDSMGHESKLIGIIDMYVKPGIIPNIAYQFLSSHCEQGLGNEALKCFLDYYFNLPSKEFKVTGEYSYLNLQDSNISPKLIKATTFWFNNRSMSLLRKNGFSLDFYERSGWTTEFNERLGVLKRMGLDIFQRDGFKFYRELEDLDKFSHNGHYSYGLCKNSLNPLSKDGYRLIVSSDPWYFSPSKRFRSIAKCSIIPMNNFHWSISEKGFYNSQKIK